MSQARRRIWNIRESGVGPQGAGPLRMKTSVSYKSWSGKWTRPTSHGTLRSHEVLGVVPHDLGLKLSYKQLDSKKNDKRNIVNCERDIVTLRTKQYQILRSTSHSPKGLWKKPA